MNTYGQIQATNSGAVGDGFPEPDIVSNIGGTAGAAISWVCDLNPKSLERVRRTSRIAGVPSAKDAVARGSSLSTFSALAARGARQGLTIFTM